MRLASEDAFKAAACWRNEATGDWNVLRAMSICIPMMEQVLAWVDEYDIEHLEVCIETPFLSRNPGTFMVQSYLFVLLQAYIYDYLVPIVPQVYLSVVHNTTSKAKMTDNGGASKAQMIAASEWSDYAAQGLTFNQAETLADAYAHSLSAYNEEFNLSELAQYTVEANCTVVGDG